MSADNVREAPHPRETTALFGHAAAEQALLSSYRSGRMPHGWLIGGEPGIGKATLCYRLARFVLAHPDPSAPAVRQATTLAVNTDDPVARRVAVQAHGGLLALERVINEKNGNLYTEIRVDDVRRSVAFFGSSAGEGGWRIAIIDSVDELNAAGINSLLKLLEEPPARSLLLLVSNAPGRVPATIRSRCRLLRLLPLASEDIARAVAAATGRDPGDATLREAAEAADGRIDRAIAQFDEKALALRQRVLDLLAQLPDPDLRVLHALGDALGGSEPATLAAFVDLVNAWLSARLDVAAPVPRRMNELALVWGKINRAARDVDTYNLERKPLVFAVFRLLADAACA
jgi:DNA polymerase-3 subunit delta'